MTESVNQESISPPSSGSSHSQSSNTFSQNNKRRSSFSFGFLSNLTNSIRPNGQQSNNTNTNLSEILNQSAIGQQNLTPNQMQSQNPFQGHTPLPAHSLNNTSRSVSSSQVQVQIQSQHQPQSFLSQQQSSLQPPSTLQPPTSLHFNHFMSNSPTIGNLNQFANGGIERITSNNLNYNSNTDNNELIDELDDDNDEEDQDVILNQQNLDNENDSDMIDIANASPSNINDTIVNPTQVPSLAPNTSTNELGCDKDGFFSIRLTPLIDHSSTSSGLYFTPVIRKLQATKKISIGRYTDKNRQAAHAPQGSSAAVVFKSKVVSRTHAQFSVAESGQWFIKDLKSSSGTFLNHVRLSPASLESKEMPLADGDIIQLGMDYRGGTEEVYRCVKMRIEMNKSWQRKVNQYNIETHNKLKFLASLKNTNPDIENELNDGTDENKDTKNELSECAICLLKLEPCQALFISPCSHCWHYKCIRPIILKSYPQFYCPNCRSMCDLETDIED